MTAERSEPQRSEAPLTFRERTAPGPGAIRVVGLAGVGLERLCEGLLGRRPPAPGELRLERLRFAGEWLDEALAIGLPDGGLELCLHGGPALIAALERALLSLGAARGAPPAPLPGPAKLGLAGLERSALARLPTALGPLAARVLLAAAEGQLGRSLRRLLFLPPAELAHEVERLAARSAAAWPLWRPPRLALLGPANAGKSTLFNCLLGRRAALVSDLPGTTRDVLVERAPLAGVVVDWIDTAGARELEVSPGASKAASQHLELEAEGQRRAWAAAGESDLVLWLTPWGQAPGAPRDWTCPVLQVTTFTPREAPCEGPGLAIDALQRPQEALARVHAAVEASLGLDHAADWVSGPTLFDPADLACLVAMARERNICGRWQALRALA